MDNASRSWPSVTLVVLNWNARSLLARSLPTLLALDYPAYEIVVVDNASTDDSVTFVREQFPQVRLIENMVNLGFSGGNNRALRQLQTEVAVLVNPDVFVEPNWLRELVAGLLSDSRIGIAGSKLYYPGGERLQHAGGYIEYPQAMPGYYGLNETNRHAHNTLRDVDYVVGAAMAVRRPVLDDIGLLDEGFFLYYEDVDLCERARRAGYRVVYVPQAVAIHEESVLTEKGSRSYMAWFHGSRWRFLLKHRSAETLLQESIPAEHDWLEALGVHSHVVAAAYIQALRQFYMTLQSRVAHGAPPITAEDAQRIADGIRRLHQAAWQTPYQDHLQPFWQLQEFTFPSRIPVLGALLSKWRKSWNNIAARAYVLPLAAQQSEFNRLVVEHATEAEVRLAAHNARHAQLATELSRQRQELSALLQRLEEIDARLSRFEGNVPQS